MRAMDTAIVASEQGVMHLGVDKAVRGRRMRSHCVNTEPTIGMACSNSRQNSDTICNIVITQLETYLVHETPSSSQMEAELGPRLLWALDDAARSPPIDSGLRPHYHACSISSPHDLERIRTFPSKNSTSPN